MSQPQQQQRWAATSTSTTTHSSVRPALHTSLRACSQDASRRGAHRRGPGPLAAAPGRGACAARCQVSRGPAAAVWTACLLVLLPRCRPDAHPHGQLSQHSRPPPHPRACFACRSRTPAVLACSALKRSYRQLLASACNTPAAAAPAAPQQHEQQQGAEAEASSHQRGVAFVSVPLAGRTRGAQGGEEERVGALSPVACCCAAPCLTSHAMHASPLCAPLTHTRRCC